MKKFRSYIVLGLVLSLLLVACGGIEGTRKTINKPTVSIRSYEGQDEDDFTFVNPGTDDVSEYSLQTIYWETSSAENWATEVAYRVGKVTKDADGNLSEEFIETPNHEVMTTSEDPAQDGWYYHYRAGANENIPLWFDAAEKTIWTTKKSATISFPANIVFESDSTATVIQDKEFVASFFEIKVRDELGQESDAVRKYFQVKTLERNISIAAKKNNFEPLTNDYEELSEIGLSLGLKFRLMGSVPFDESPAWYYKYRIHKVSFETVAASDGSDSLKITYDESSEWQSTKGQVDQFGAPKTDETVIYADHPKVKIQGNIRKILYPNQYNCVEAFAVDYSNIETEVSKVYFYVSDRFNPKSLIYRKECLAVGQYHFALDPDPKIDNIPHTTTLSNGLTVNATQFFTESDSSYTAVYSDDFSLRLQWGYSGEYPLDRTFEQKKQNQVLDRDTGDNYFSDIIAIDIRLNGDAYDYPALGANAIIVDDEGSTAGQRWLRIPPKHSIASYLFVPSSRLKHGSEKDENSLNTFEVRVLDEQGVASNPEKLEFYLIDPIAPENRAGTLIIDDTVHSARFFDAPAADYYNDVVTEVFANGDEIIDTIDLNELKGMMNPVDADAYWAHNARTYPCVLAPSELMKYKRIFVYSNSPGSALIHEQFDGLVIDQRLGGNMIMTGSSLISTIYDDLRNAKSSLMSSFGITWRQPNIASANPALSSLVFRSLANSEFALAGMNGQENFPSVSFETDRELNQVINPAFVMRGAGNNGAYITNRSLLPTADVIGTFNCSDSNADLYNELNGKTVALKNTAANFGSSVENKNYLFTFPLAVMKKAEVIELLRQVAND